MKWNEVTRIDISGDKLIIKDAMIMLGEDETEPEWPYVTIQPGEYILEIYVPVPFYAHRARVRKVDTAPNLGEDIGNVSIDNAFAGFIDYTPFLAAVKNDFDAYEEWTMCELDDELAINFSGEIYFCDEKLIYVKSGDGDGEYPVFELVEDGKQVGLECIFIP